MKILKKVFSWVLVSSVNSNRFSLTLKAGVPLLVLLGIGDTETLTNLTGAIGELVVLIGQVVAGAFTVWGLVRKIFNTYK